MERKHIALLFSLLLAIGGLILLPRGQAQGVEEGGGDAFPRPHRYNRWRLLFFILTHSESTTLEGDLLLIEGRLLVLEVEGEEVYVVMPQRWLVGGEVLTIEELFDGDPIALGDAIAIKALRLMHEGESYIVEFYAAYEITGEGVEARALTPFNIRPI